MDSARQPSPTASAEPASRSDPDMGGVDRATKATEGTSRGSPRPACWKSRASIGTSVARDRRF
jgi:hypothetical protein